MLRMMRNKNFVLIVIAIALTGFIATLFLSTQGEAPQISLGKINNKSVTPQEYESAWSNVRQNLYGDGELNPQERGMLPTATWDALVYETLFLQVIEEMGLEASDTAIYKYLELNPHPAFRQSPYFQTNGQFDIEKYRQMIFTQSGFFDNTQNEHIIQQIENETRLKTLPNMMLQVLLAAGKMPSKSEVEYLYHAQNSKVLYEYASVHQGVERVELEDVTEDQIQDYYTQNSDAYSSDVDQASLYIVRYSKIPDAIDRAIIVQTLANLRDTVIATEELDFSDVAYESDDPEGAKNGGDMGWVPRGFSQRFQNNPMAYESYKALEDTLFSLKEGEISQPFDMLKTSIALVAVDSIKMEGDSITAVKARQIVKEIVPREEKLDSLERAAEKLSAEAKEGEFLKTAKSLGLYVDSTSLYRKGDLVPVIAYAEGLGKFIFDKSNNAGAVSSVFENESAYYVVSIKSKVKAGVTPKKFVENVIRRAIADSLTIVNQLGVLEKSFASYDGNESLEDFTAKDSNLTYGVTDTISLLQYVSGIGANAAPTSLALNTLLNKASKPVKGDLGAYVVRPLYQDVADFSKVTDAEYMSLANRIRSAAIYSAQNYGKVAGNTRAFDEWYSALKDEAGIKSNVAQFYY